MPLSPMPAPSRAPLGAFLLHWSLAAAVTINLLTGLRIAGDAPDAAWSRALGPLLPQGEVLHWHLGAAVVVLAAAVGYGLWLWRTGALARLTALWRVPADWRARLRADPPAARWRAVNQALTWLAIALLGVLAATGLTLYLGAAPGSETIRAVHRGAAWGLLLFVPAHVATHLLTGGWARLAGMLLPGGRRLALGLGVVGAAVLVGGGLAVADRATLGTLPVGYARVAPTLDGRPDDPAWQQARPVLVRTSAGANLPGRETAVRVRALHDGRDAWFLFEWRDPTRSLDHLPLLRTAHGWSIGQNAARRADETTHYEDKLAVLIGRGDPTAARRSVHLGPRPLAGEPGAPHRRGLHYTTDGQRLDLWHWQAVRTNAFGQADDGWFGAPLPAARPLPPAGMAGTDAPREHRPIPERYTAGYQKDPPLTWSSHELNWEVFDEGPVQPRWLPNAEALADLAAAPDGAPPRPWLDLSDTIPYAPALDRLPVGTRLPSVLLASPLPGDRGDVSAIGTWADGRWRLEVRRRLDTGSDYDQPLDDDSLLWVAVFDGAQTRHSHHLRPLRLRLAAVTP